MRILYYGLLRVALFFVLWWVGLQLGLGMVMATLAAAILTFAVSYLFLGRLRRGATQDLSAAWEGRPGRRGRTEAADAEAEDAYTQGRFRE
ncbi:DUF4229 domain-containing protein [Micrococcus luteus]|uniref:DUF4229 domain-containing protein n=1 Tax=Micrococcus TaxID=1269 RepID=UPI000DEA903B|nr:MULTISPECIES: DUF4229 domain-containing protein [Micrococcus]MCJ2193977.1 DUF4229 domain-containing protein [Kaistella montana]MCK6089846.1 DUF4229 domain-containing protein [Micrococcus endophyticus]AYO50206.1 DUF4229 domain-containing protein [Micrococcus luteus]MBU8651050.1 DUF4229 domain-containing protein [Micrococcus luteus]MCD0180579.1 DUF4229 domain-containing protein [Micrococcus luteus]